MSDPIDPSEGYRLLHTGEEIRTGDQFYRMPYGWRDVISVAGQTYDSVEHYPIRRRLQDDPLPVEPSELDTLREQVAALTAERDDLRQKLDKAEKMTPERACEIVNQLRQANQLEVRSNTEEWFKPLGPENWQCRPAKPRPVKLTVTCPPSQREAVEAAIRAAGGSV